MSRDRSPRRWGAGFDAKSATSASLYRVNPSGWGHVTGYVGAWRCIQGRFKNMFSFLSRVLRKRNWHLAGAATEWKKKRRVKSYHRHTMGQLSWFQPLARESRSTSRFATAPRFCFCCSSDAAPPPHRCLSGRGASLRKPGMGASHVKILHVPIKTVTSKGI